MNKLTKYILATVSLVLAVFSCVEDRDIEDGMLMSEVRQIINQNTADAIDTAAVFRALITAIDGPGIHDSIDDHRILINALIAGDIESELRIYTLELTDHSHSNASILNATTSPFTTGLKSTYDGYASTLTTHTTTLSSLQDSLYNHTDSIQKLRVDVNTALNTGGTGSGTGDVKVSGTTDPNMLAYWGGTDSTLVSNDVMRPYPDSIALTEELHARDTIKLQYLAGSTTGSRFPVLTSTGGLDSGVLTNQSIQLRMKIDPVYKYFFDRKDNELTYFYQTKDSLLVKNYGVAKDNKTGKSFGLQSIEMLIGAYERAIRYLFRLWVENKIQWLFIFIMLFYIRKQHIEIKKLKKNE